jgi:hypothetical protein
LSAYRVGSPTKPSFGSRFDKEGLVVTARYSGLRWRKSSTSSGPDSVEVAFPEEDGVLVRDSKDADGPVLLFTHDEWRAFVGGVKLGEFDA